MSPLTPVNRFRSVVGVVAVALPSPLTPVNGSPPLGPADGRLWRQTLRAVWAWTLTLETVRSAWSEVAGVIAWAEETFGSREKARAGLRCPTAALANESLRDLLDTDEGAREVETCLGRIAGGIG